MHTTRSGFRSTGLWFVALTFLLAFTVGCASMFSDDEGPGGGPIGPTWVLSGVAAAPTSVDMGVDAAITATVSNPDAVALTYTWDGGGGTIVGAEAAVTWSHDVAGTYIITCTVADGANNSDSASTTVVVGGVTGYTWALTGLNASNLTPGVGDDVTVTAAVSNPDAVALTYSWTGGGTFVGTAEAVTWSSDVEGNFTLTVVVSDGTDDETLGVDVVVTGVPVIDPPVFMDDSVDPPVAFELHGDVHAPVATQRIWFHGIKAISPDDYALTYEWTADGAGEFTDISVDDDGFAAAYWAADEAGTFVITLTADDGQGGVSSVSSVTGLSTEEIAVVAYPESFTVVGFDGCNMCHSDTVTTWQATNHADAIERSLGIEEGAYGYRNEHCLHCHAAGMFPVGEGGFIDFETTPEFGNIQCESCHGTGNPAGMGGGHKPSPMDPGMGYEKDVDGNYVVIDGVYQYDEAYDGANGYGCGLCHEGSRHGAFESWMDSVHAHAPIMEDDGEGNMVPTHEMSGGSCAKCHNGGEFVRVIVDGGETEEILPEDFDVTSAMIGCATCHDPHSNQYEGQLRIDSEGEVPIPFSAVDDVPAMVSGGRGNTCISCHNGRRDMGDYISRVTKGSGHFGPHGNPQGATLFGMMAGAIPYTDPPVLTVLDSDHAHQSMAQDTCVDCHMWSRDYISSDEPKLWGHEMVPVIEACAVCHVGETDMASLTAGMHTEFEETMQAFVDAWPAIWKDVAIPAEPELYNRPVVSDPPEAEDHEGPAKEDAVGNAYRATLWVWYLWNNDKSSGMHNPTYFRSSMGAAQAELEALNAVNFP